MVLCRAALIAFLSAAVAAQSFAQSSTSTALQQGFQALHDGEVERADAIFRTALAEHPRDPQLLVGAGVVAQMQGREREAMSRLKQALDIDPQFAPAAAMMGELLYRQGDVDLAIKMYERLLPLAPPTVMPSIRERLDAWRAEAALPQNRSAIKDDRFSISFDGPMQQKLAERATSVLTSAFWRVGKTLGAYPSSPINVILYSERQFHDITGAPEWAGGGFDGQIRVPVRGASQNLAEFDRVLTHELTHAMLHAIAPNVPAWLNEGLAMYSEGRDGAEAGRRLARAGVFVPLARLQTSFSGLNAAQALVAYEESAFAARALLDRIGTPALGQLLQDLGTGQTIEQAIAHAGTTFDAFESDLARRVGVSVRSAPR